MSKQLYIGLMSGTSIDGIDGVIVDCQDNYKIIATSSLDWDEETHKKLHQLCTAGTDSDNLDSIALLQNAIAQHESEVVKDLLSQMSLSPSDIIAIGSHGQTVRHHPNLGFSVQLDNGPLLAALTDIDTIVNFRMADIAQGGEGAPLTPAFHQALLRSPDCSRFILNLGGIANVTALNTSGEILTGFDTGPANTLLDLVCRTYLHQDCDFNGERAAAGTVDEEMLSTLLQHPYLRRDFPKSTGREDFNADTIQEFCDALPQHHESPAFTRAINNMLATLTEFTALSVMHAVEQICVQFNLLGPKEMIVCGGGALNTFLLQRLQDLGSRLTITTISGNEILPEQKYLEAQAFAYFASCFVHRKPLNLSKATHAKQPSLLGCLCPAPHGAYIEQRQQD